MEENSLKLGLDVEVNGFDELKEKVQYLEFLVKETEKTLNFLKDYKFSLSCKCSIPAEFKNSSQLE